jgi:uncharacterized membrane protein YciS (DUF1049 family)
MGTGFFAVSTLAIGFAAGFITCAFICLVGYVWLICQTRTLDEDV